MQGGHAQLTGAGEQQSVGVCSTIRQSTSQAVNSARQSRTACSVRDELAEQGMDDLGGYAGQDVCHVVHTKILQLISHTLHPGDVYGLWGAKHHL